MEDNKNIKDTIELTDVKKYFNDASKMLNQSLMYFTLRDVVNRKECKERDEAIELYKNIAKVSNWLKENSI